MGHGVGHEDNLRVNIWNDSCELSGLKILETIAGANKLGHFSHVCVLYLCGSYVHCVWVLYSVVRCYVYACCTV
jgi:hypothetical protein